MMRACKHTANIVLDLSACLQKDDPHQLSQVKLLITTVIRTRTPQAFSTQIKPLAENNFSALGGIYLLRNWTEQAVVNIHAAVKVFPS